MIFAIVTQLFHLAIAELATLSVLSRIWLNTDAGSQFTSVCFTERLIEIGARPSIGTVADSFYNALAEMVNGLYKAECVYGPDAARWDDVEYLELAML